ncbi:hypothetical protein KY284_029922 [Solanum tuberosum]|nr:hypothetical protein KY284_029922 [Solanum tuberosum]
MKNSYSILILVVQFLCFSFSLGGDTISVNESVSSGQTIISSGGNFELGFFKPGDSPSYYIGIWYKKLYPQAVVWVANRDKPLDSAHANLIISQGNLVLLDRLQNSIWHQCPYYFGKVLITQHTFMPGAKIGYDKRTQRKQVLVSWKNSSDPAPGMYSLEMDPKNVQYVIKWNRTTECWASGSWNGQRFSSVPEMSLNYIYNYSYIDNENESYFTYSLYNSTITSRLIMDVSGQIKQLSWLDGDIDWNLFWAQPRQICDVYAKCGAFGVCTEANATCNCLNGFKPRSDTEWNSNDYSSGCVRDQKVQCNAITEDKDSLWISSIMRVPASQNTNITVVTASQCRAACFKDCSCTAYTYDGSGTCSIWTGDLFNLEQLSTTESERTIFVKRGSPEAQTKAKKSMKLKAILSSISVLTFLLIGSISYIYYRRRIAKRADRSKGIQGAHKSHWHKAEGEAKVLMNENSDEAIDVPYFHLETILEATDNFSNANKLGQGGFGPVYKVQTSFLHLCGLKRYDIILGIARGLSYLHHDSRLRIIHRDLKTSNILLDEEMNPKISDFGLARIVEGKVTEAFTKKIVGTYGYMSPEYALDGLFSIKSDVFSFGVVVLEIVSGRRNTGFYQSEEALNLLGYAWKLWTEKAETQLIEKSLLESCNRSEAIKCINIALLCVQEDPNHRPNMSDVILMLGGEGTNLPTPNRPAFVIRTHASSTSSSSCDKKYIVSNNQVTITVEEGR